MNVICSLYFSSLSPPFLFLFSLSSLFRSDWEEICPFSRQRNSYCRNLKLVHCWSFFCYRKQTKSYPFTVLFVKLSIQAINISKLLDKNNLFLNLFNNFFIFKKISLSIRLFHPLHWTFAFIRFACWRKVSSGILMFFWNWRPSVNLEL